jgi:mono/diheme cytochrome c family protein
MRWGIAVMAALVLIFPAYRVIEPGLRGDRAEALEAHLAAQGEEIYRAECAECHGVDDQRGEKAPTLNSAQFLLTTVDDRIESLISAGVPGTDMKPFSLDFGGRLTSEQIRAVSTYLRSLEEDSPDLPDWREWPGDA